MAPSPIPSTVHFSTMDIPPFPAVALRALQLASDNDTRLRDLHDLISSDPAFTGEILKIANSPLYGIRAEIKNTLQATMLLGFERVRAIALAIGMRSYLKGSMEYPSLKASWRHSLATAIIADQVARASRGDNDSAYTAGLIHDIGRAALIALNPKAYATFLNGSALNSREILVAERTALGIDHCQAGCSLVTSWSLPESYISITLQHHDQANFGKGILHFVQLGCRIADAVDFGITPTASDSSYEEIWPELSQEIRNYLPKDPEILKKQIREKIGHIEAA